MNTENQRDNRLITVLRIALPIIFVLLGVLAAKRIYDTRPKPERRAPMRVEPLVDVAIVTRTTHTPILRAYGEVIAARQVDLQPLVSGEVIEVHPAFREGGIIPAGETIIMMDPRDYALAVSRAEASVARAQLALRVEEGAGEVAVRERRLLGDEAGLSASEEALVRRDPHRTAARKALASAEADLAQATLNLERTHVRAPFTALIQSRGIELGGLASPQRAIAHIVDAETYWVRVSVPMNRVRPVMDAQPGPEAAITVHAADGVMCTGQLVGHVGTVDERGRMAALLVSIPGPGADNNGSTPMLGDYTEVRLPVTTLHDVVELPQSVLHDDDCVWLANADNALEIRPVSIAWRDRDHVYVSAGLTDGDRVITTALSSAVEGTSLRITGGEQP